jgi:hypothetical protein
VIHVDHKGVLPRSDSYSNILVVTDALTRFTLYIPVPDTTAETTLKTLMARVFSVFGFPLTIITDNGPCFKSDMMKHMAAFFGFRHVPILPYNAQANGAAEASVKRIKLLLDRHTQGYQEWHKILPLAQMILNSQVCSSTNMSPYMALFGREPIGIELLENPALLPSDSPGTEWLLEVKDKMTRIHKDLQHVSDTIKKGRATKANRRRGTSEAPTPVIKASTPFQDRYVRILRGSNDDAKYLRKHGHGQPWKYKYKVLQAFPHAVQLEVPKDGSVPRINPWQLTRRCEPAPERLETPQQDDPLLTEHGIPLPDTTTNGAEEELQNLREIDRIVSCDRVGSRYRLWIKWKDIAEVTPTWRHEILPQLTDEKFINQIHDAVTRCNERNNDHHYELTNDGDPVEDNDELDAVDDANNSNPAPPTADQDVQAQPEPDVEQLGRGKRIRAQAKLHNIPIMAVYPVDPIIILPLHFADCFVELPL